MSGLIQAAFGQTDGFDALHKATGDFDDALTELANGLVSLATTDVPIGTPTYQDRIGLSEAAFAAGDYGTAAEAAMNAVLLARRAGDKAGELKAAEQAAKSDNAAGGPSFFAETTISIP
jgi:hypothetical protein